MKEDFRQLAHPNGGGQAIGYAFIDLRDPIALVNAIDPEKWEASALAVLTSALSNHKFIRLMREKCNFVFDNKGFLTKLREKYPRETV